MNRIFSVLFPAFMLAGLIVSAFVIVASLQAASSTVTAPAAAQPASSVNPNELAAQGRALFVAKGCIVCHRHGDLAAVRASMEQFDFDDVPNLTKLKISEEYLRRWLADPQALKPSTTMPQLDLSASELDALAAFLTMPRE